VAPIKRLILANGAQPLGAVSVWQSPAAHTASAAVGLAGVLRSEIRENILQGANPRREWVAVISDRAGQKSDEGELLFVERCQGA
jgi:hypothetical protein